MSSNLCWPRCGWNRETILHVIVQCEGFGVLLNTCYQEYVYTASSESIIKIVPPSFLSRESKICLLVVVVIAKEAIQKARVKGLRAGVFVSGLSELFHSSPKRKNRSSEKMPAQRNV